MTPDPNLRNRDLEIFQERLSSVGNSFPVTRTLVVVNVVVLIGMVLAGDNPLSPTGEIAVAWGSNFGPLTLSGQWWRLLSSVFIHFGALHCAVNMWSLYAVGRLVEPLYGRLSFLTLYLVSGIGGSLASVAWNPGVHSAGASGAVFGVVGGLLVFMMSPRYGVPRLMMGEVGRSALLIVVINLGLGASIHGIDNAAHIGGLASGLVAGSMLARPLDPDYRRSHPLGGIGMTLLFLGALLLGSITLLTARADVARAAAVSAAPHFHVARPDPDDG